MTSNLSIIDEAKCFICHPDMVLPEEGEPRPLQLAVAVAIGILGMGSFLGVVGLGIPGGVDASVLALLVVPACGNS